MKYTSLFGKTVRDVSKDMQFVSHRLLHQGGFVRESTSGRYYFLPLGWKVHQKITNIIKEEMDATGAQEMISPILHPLELWEETNRTSSVGFELMKVADQRGAEFALGGTAEEMFVDLVRKLQISYKELPFNIYQFSTKFRDEKRARGGLLRVREFVMKDAYSFDKDEESFKITYNNMSRAYFKIFERLGLKVLSVEADNGYIGGEYCHEFQVESEIGEGRFFMSEDGTYTAHEDVAKFKLDFKNIDEDLKQLEVVDAERGNTMEDGVSFHNLPLWQQIKDVMFSDVEGNLYLAVIRGDLEVNKVKLEYVINKVGQLELATEDQIRGIGSEPGFISPIGLEGRVMIIADNSIRTVRNMYGGYNAKYKDAMNINIDRDFSASVEGDIAMAQPGFMSISGSKLVEKRGIEVGNIFQLGYHYTNLMPGAEFMNDQGKSQKYYMGCYGLGIGRTIAAIVEKSHDDRGIIWPMSIAPYQVHLIPLGGKSDPTFKLAEQEYKKMNASGIEVLFDDREESAGVKFADADLIGIPIRIVIGERGLQDGKIEVKKRSEDESIMIPLDELTKYVDSIISSMIG